MFILIFLVSLFFSLRFNFYSLRNIKKSFIYLFEADGEGEISPLASLSTSLAATLGTGNIVGVGQAIALGGPGAIFWMWITALLGSILQFSEGALSRKYRRKIDGEYCGGPMFYLEGIKGIGKYLALFYAFLIVLASFIIGNMIQVSSIIKTNEIKYIGIIILVLVSFSIVGGIKKIGLICEKLIPLLTLIYIVLTIIVLAVCFENIVPSIKMILDNAFSVKAVKGGFFGGVLKYGISRGVFTNEAGLGSGAIAYGASKNRYCYKVGLIASLGVIFDTIIMCSLTALVVLASGNITFIDGVMNEIDPNLITQIAFSKSIGRIGDVMIQILMFIYGLATIIGWYYFGLVGFKYIFNHDKGFKYIYLFFIVLGIILDNYLIWNFVDVINVLLAIINLFGLIYLQKDIKKIIKNKE